MGRGAVAFGACALIERTLMLPLYSDPSYGAALAVAAVFFVIAVIFGLIAYVIGSFFLMKIFEKAGVQGKWRAWIPVYNTMIFAKLGDLNPLWLLVLWGAGIVLNWIPVIGFIGSLAFIAAGVYMVLAAYRVGLKLQKEAVWVILYIFLSIVWLGIAAFDKSRWNTAVAPAPWANSFLRDTTVWEGVPVQTAAAPGYPAAPGYSAAPAGAAPGAYPPPAASYPPPAAPPAAPEAPEDPNAPRP
jgi:hypothetical protein